MISIIIGISVSISAASLASFDPSSTQVLSRVPAEEHPNLSRDDERKELSRPWESVSRANKMNALRDDARIFLRLIVSLEIKNPAQLICLLLFLDCASKGTDNKPSRYNLQQHCISINSCAIENDHRHVFGLRATRRIVIDYIRARGLQFTKLYTDIYVYVYVYSSIYGDHDMVLITRAVI